MNDLETKIQKARELGVPEEVIEKRIKKKYPDYFDTQQPLEREISKTGAFDLPVLGRLLRGLVSPTESYGRMVLGTGYEGVRAGASALGDKNAYSPQMQNPFLSNEDLGKLTSSPMEGLGRTAGAIGAAASAYGGPKLAQLGVNAVKGIPQIPKYLTKKGVANLTTKRAASASEAGKSIDFKKMAQTIREKATDRLGETKDVKKALNSLIFEKTPAELGVPKLNPSELLKWRRQIQARGAGQGVLQNLFKGSNIEDKVNSIARSEISRELHKLVPETIKPDKVYATYSKFKGDVPTWAKRILIEEILRRTIGGPVVRAVTGGLSQ